MIYKWWTNPLNNLWKKIQHQPPNLHLNLLLHPTSTSSKKRRDKEKVQISTKSMMMTIKLKDETYTTDIALRSEKEEMYPLTSPET